MARTESKTPIWGVIAVLALLAVGANFLLRILSDPASGMDFSIYRLGAMTIFDNEGFTQDLYSPTLNDHGVIKPPFTYPPFAAMLFLPFAFMPLVVGKVLMVLGSVVVAWWLSTVIYNYVNARGRELPLQRYFGRVGTIAVLTLLVVAAGPWQRTIDLIQINPFITALILADFVRPATRVPRGVLIGIAGGVKLTPLVFGLILLVRRDWKGIATLGATFFATIALGFILMPKEAPEFWFSALTNPSRVGGLNYVDNISIQGWLLHFGLSEGAAKPVYYALALVSIVLTAGLLYQLERRGAALAQVAVTASLMVALSPISWSHHNVLLPLLVVVLVLDAFPTYFAPQPAWLRVAAACFAWVAVLGLYISPMRIASWMHGSMDDMEHLAAGALAVSAIPAFCLWVTMMLWSVAALSAPVRGAKVEPVQYGSVRSDAPLGWWGARALVTGRAESVRAATSRGATA